MKIHMHVLVVLAFVSMCVAGCGSSGPKRLDTATASIAETSDLLQEGTEQVELVVERMNDLPSAKNRKKAFAKFSNDVLGALSSTHDAGSDKVKTPPCNHQAIDKWHL